MTVGERWWPLSYWEPATVTRPVNRIVVQEFVQFERKQRDAVIAEWLAHEARHGAPHCDACALRECEWLETRDEAEDRDAERPCPNAGRLRAVLRNAFAAVERLNRATGHR